MVLSSVLVAKLGPLATCPRVLAQIDVALELQYSDWRAVGCLWVESNVPDTGCRILWVAVSACVDKVLLRCCVGTDERDKIMGIDGLGLKQLDQNVCRIFLSRQKTGRASFGVVLAANERTNAGTKWADNL